MSYQDDREGGLTLGILYREETGVSVTLQKKQYYMWMRIYNRYVHLLVPEWLVGKGHFYSGMATRLVSHLGQKN